MNSGIKAQDGNNGSSNMNSTIDMYPKAPEAAAMSKLVDIPAGNYNGVADFSIPLYTIEFDGQKIPIELRYTTTGIKVDQIASRVGLGWVLNAGPSLSQQVIGRQDTYFPRPFFDPSNFSPNSATSTEDPSYKLARKAAGMGSEQVDLEPDIFTYRLLSKSGKYILDNTGNKGISIPYDQTKITTEDYRNKMILADEQGYKYIFNSSDIDRIKNMNTCIISGDMEFVYDDPNYKVSQIISPKNEVVNFIYTASIADFKYIPNVQTQVSLGMLLQVAAPIGSMIVPAHVNKCINYSTSRETALSEIRFKGGKIQFSYSNKNSEQRSDLPGDVYLKNVTVVNDKGQTIKSFTLTYDYFSSLSSTIPAEFNTLTSYSQGMDKRLKLINVKDNLTNGTYILDYYETAIDGKKLPRRASNDQDFWGVYNGANNGERAISITAIGTPYYSDADKYLKANKDPDIRYGILGNLKKITYPTGGYTQMEYEADNYGDFSTVIIYYSETTREEPFFEANDNNYLPVKTPFTISDIATDKVLEFVKNPSDGVYTNPYACRWHLRNVDTNTETNGGGVSAFLNRNDPPGNYELWLTQGDTFPNQKCSAMYRWVETTTTTTNIPIDTLYIDGKKLGTIRIKKIESFDNNNGKTVREYTYRNPTENHILPYINSSGVIHGDLEFSSKVIRVSPMDDKDHSSIETLLVNNPGWQTSSVNGKTIGYTYVQEYYKDESHPENSYRKEYEFLNDDGNTPVYGEDNGTSVTWTPGNMDRGFVKEEVLFNSDNQKVKETFKTYKRDGYYNVKYGAGNTYNEYIMGYGLKIYPRSKFGNQGGMFKFNYRPYNLTNTWIREDSVRVRDYTNGVDYVETIQTNNYSIPSYKHTYPTESLSAGSGNVMKTTFKYPQDITVASEVGAAQSQVALDALVTQNHLSDPLIVKSYKNNVVNSEVRTLYEQYNTDVSGKTMVLPKYIYMKKGENADAADRKITFNSYDTQGNLTQYTLENGIPVAVIWGYNKTKPIAKIEGAQLSDISTTLRDNIVNPSNADNIYLPSVSADETEQNLIDALDTFRKSLPNYQITTYTYDPLFGVRSVTPPSGLREYYTYDAAGRPLEVKRAEKDAGGNEVFRVLKKNEYHYKQP